MVGKVRGAEDESIRSPQTTFEDPAWGSGGGRGAVEGVQPPKLRRDEV